MNKEEDSIILSAKKEADQKLKSLKELFISTIKKKRSAGIKIVVK